MVAIENRPSLDSYSFLSFSNLGKWAVKIGPRVFVIGLVGYAALGYAYELGIMAEIDRIAIPIIKSQVGYMGLGAAMPVFQWYAAWAVRITAALSAEALFELALMVAKSVYNWFRELFEVLIYPEKSDKEQLLPI